MHINKKEAVKDRKVDVNYKSIRLKLRIILLLLIVIPKFVKASEDKDAKYTKRITMLGLIGLSGLISPLVGFVFALPAFVLSMVALTKNAPHRRRTILITSITTLLCILYVIVGVVINPRNN